MSQPQPAVEPFARHYWPLYAMALTPDGSQIVTGGGDGAIRRWDTVTGAPVGDPIAADTDWVLSLAVNPDGLVISGGGGGTIRLRGHSIGPLPGHEGLVWSVSASSDRIVSGSADGTIRLWDITTGRPIGSPLAGHKGPVRAVATSPYHDLIVSGGVDGTVRRWDAATGAAIGEPLTGHQSWVYAVALSPDGKQIISAGDDTILRWNLATGAPIGDPLTGHTADVASERTTGYAGGVFTVTMTPDGTQIISGGSDGTIRRWDATTGSAIGAPLTGHTDWVRTVAVTPDGNQIISSGNDGTIRRWNLGTGEAIDAPLTNPAVPVNAVAVNQDTGLVVSASIDGSIRLWDDETGAARGRLRSSDGWINAIAISPDGRQIARAGEDGIVERWDGGTQVRYVRSLEGHDRGVRAIAFTPNSQVIVTAGADGTVRRWDSRTGDPIGAPMTGHRGAINAVTVTPDGKRIITAGREDGRIIRWSVRTGDSVGESVGEWVSGHDGGVLTVAVSPAGDRIVSGGGDGTLRMWDRRGQDPQELRGGHNREVTVVRFSADGRRIISGGADGVIRQWDAATGEPIGAPITGHEDTVTSLAIPDDGTTILSGSADGTVRRWDLATGKQVPGGMTELPADVLADVLSDLESDEDRLDIAEDVNRIGAMLAALSVQPPLSVALLGDWGTGKSSFMRQLRNRLRDLAKKSREAGGSAYASNLRQVTFNAWHYSDDHLWVGLIEHMFRELATEDTAPDTGTAEQVADLKDALSDKKDERRRLTADLASIDRIDTEHSSLGALRALLRSARVARAALASMGRQPRAWLALLVAGLVVAGVILVVLFGQSQIAWVGGVVTAAAGLASPIVTAWRKLAKSTEDVRERLELSKNNLDKDIKAANVELARIEPAHRLKSLLVEISTAERYESFRGLTGRIHHDLRRLSEDLAAARKTWLDGGGKGTPPLQRIVLYVDDLDRCTPQRVVDVLQAVNLLLTMDLFMVVVAVDPRWLLKALGRHHRGLLRDAGAERRQVSALDYLDKIFHIPFALRPMGSRAGTFLRSMLPVEEVLEPVREPDPVQTTEKTTTTPTEQTESRPGPDVNEVPVLATQTAPQPVAELNSEGLRVRQSEQDFLARLAPLLPTPRAVKKLANLYRLVRLSIRPGQLDDFLGGPYQAAALLLATLVGDPRGARKLLVTLKTAAPDQDITLVLSDSDDRLATLVKELRDSGVTVHGDATTYRLWATAVARYGFETYDLFTEDAAKR